MPSSKSTARNLTDMIAKLLKIKLILSDFFCLSFRVNTNLREFLYTFCLALASETDLINFIQQFSMSL